MVSTINPNSAGAAALGADQRHARNGPAPAPPRTDSARAGDRVELGDAANWSAARDSVRNGLAQVRQALGVGQEAQAMLAQVLHLAGGADAGAQAQLEGVLAALEERVAGAIGGGVKVLAGETLAVSAEPGTPPVEVTGVDLRLKDSPGAGDAMRVPRGARVGDADLAQSARASMDTLTQAMDRLSVAARALESHQGFLGAAEGAGAGVQGVRTDLDADAARLLALQVRQGLDAAGSRSIANFEPQAVLSLFRS